MDRWEYEIHHMSSFSAEAWRTQDMLREMGEQGWELVAVPVKPSSGEMSYIFKRRKAHG